MARIKLNQRIYDVHNRVVTAGDLLDEGGAIVEKSDGWLSSHTESGYTTKYLLRLLDDGGNPTNEVYEIGQKAYESRAAKGQDKRPARKPAASPVLLPVSFDGHTLQIGTLLFFPAYDRETESFMFRMPRTPDWETIHDAMQAAFSVFEYDYGDTITINFWDDARVFVYGMFRPPGYGTCPDRRIVELDSEHFTDEYLWHVRYGRRLMPDEVARYDMFPVSDNAYEFAIGAPVLYAEQDEAIVTGHAERGRYIVECYGMQISAHRKDLDPR